MRPYTLPLLIVQIIILLTIIYIILKVKKTKISTSYMLLLINVLIWINITFVLHNVPVSSFTFLLLRFSSIFSFTLGLSVLNFTYEFLGRKKDNVFKSFFLLSLFSILFYNFTPLILDFRNLPGPFEGMKYTTSPYFMAHPYSVIILKFLVFFNIIVPILLSFYLVYRRSKKEIIRDRKKQLNLFLIGGGVTLFIGIMTTMAMSRYLSGKYFTSLQVLTAVSLVTFTFFGMRKYGFLSPSIEAFSGDLLNQARDGIIIINTNNRIVDMNKAARNLLDLHNFCIEEMKINEVIKEYEPEDEKNELKIKREDKIYRVRKIPLSDGSKIIGKALIIIDVTTQERLEEELLKLNAELQEKVAERTQILEETIDELREQINIREEVEKELNEVATLYKSLFESGSDAIFLHDVEGYIIDANKRACSMTNLEKEEIIDKNILELIKFSGDYRDIILNLEDVKSEDLIIEGEILKKDNDIVYIEANIEEVMIENKRDFIVFVRDITQRKEMENYLINMTKLESISTFAGGIAHDFNNLLTAVFGYLSIIKIYNQKESRLYKKIEEIEKILEHAKSLTAQLLSLSKGGEPIKEKSSIKELLIDTVEFALSGSDIKPVFHIDEDLPFLNIDRSQISRVIQNIIINAMEALKDKENKKIEVIAKVTQVPHYINNFMKKDKVLKITIKDNGPGIPKEILNKIFDPFFTTKKRGTGLGLAATYSIIKKHGGYIDVDSIPGEGSAFHIYLPISEDSLCTEKSSYSTLNMEKVEGIRVLIMDDEDAIRDFLYDALTIKGYIVDVAKDGEEAIEKYKEALLKGKRFDIVILDLTVPGGMGGREAITKLKKIDPYVSAIVSSGYSETDTLPKYREYGFLAYLQKPYTLSKLYATIVKIISEKYRR